MRFLITVFLLLASTFALYGALTDEEVVTFLDEKPIPGYEIQPTDHGLPASSSGFTILNYDQLMVDGIWRILEDPNHQENWKSAFISLRRIIAAEADMVEFDQVMAWVEGIERDETIIDKDKVDLLQLAYPAVARHRNDPAFEFLRARTQFEFWEGKEVSRKVYVADGAGSGGILKTGQSEAISALDELQTDEAYALLKSLAVDPRYTEQPHLNLALQGSLRYGWEASRLRMETIQSEYAKRLELRREALKPQAEPSVLDESPTPVSIEAPSVTANEVIEVLEPQTQVADEGDQVVPEDKGNRFPWLWLLIALVLGAILSLLRPKA